MTSDSRKRSGDTAAAEKADLDLGGEAYDQPPYAGAVRVYVIAGSQRVGSTLLCHMLAASGAMGVPTEYFKVHQPPLPVIRFGALDANRGLRVRHYVDELRRRRTTPNGVFGLKLQVNQLDAHVRAAAFRELLVGARYVWLRRRDAVAQAVSMVLALSTGRFHAARESAERPPEIAYDENLLRKALATIAFEEMRWRIHFEANGIEPLELWYEDLMSDPDPPCRRICRLMDVEPDRRFTREGAPTRQLRSAANEAWRTRLMADARLTVGD